MATTAEAVNSAFKDDTKLRKRIFDAINETPQHEPLFGDIARYILTDEPASVDKLDRIKRETDLAEQPAKKRKLEDASSVTNGSSSNQPRTVILEARDISFTLPQRKKLHLSIIQYGSNFSDPSTTFALCGRNPATSQVEFEYPITAFAYVMRVPVPEKAQKQYNFCLLPSQSATSSNDLTDGLIWTVNHGPLKSVQIHAGELKALIGTENVLEDALDTILQRNGNKLVYPDERQFVSALVESHRKNDKSYHVKAFRGGKDGYLFFLENGIFFGFKKPLAFFPFENIESVSYTAVLKRTFNLVIVARTSNTAEEQEIEFSMLDQADFANIDSYIKRHQLQDASMAEARRAKQFKVNGAKGGAAEDQNSDGQTELQKAEQELEDEEDEMEEDYDPGSDGESEGSGSSDDDDEYDFGKAARGKDIVKEELGSEAEDVEVTDEEVEDEDEEVEEEEEEVIVPNTTSQGQRNRPKELPAPTSFTHARDARGEVPAQKANQQMAVNVKPLTQPSQGVPDVDDEDQL